MNQKPLVLIPAAGFGTRVGSPEAKELLSGPDGRPLIELALNQARERGWPVHVITRKEKVSLLNYLQSVSGLDLNIQIIEPSREWPDTILKSKSHWHERNLLCLPDTAFLPLKIWDQLAASPAEIAAAVFKPENFQKWGVLNISENDQLEICEKPEMNREGMQAWGLMSFTKDAGEELLQNQLQSTFDHQWRKISRKAEFFQLESFVDLTRNGINPQTSKLNI